MRLPRLSGMLPRLSVSHFSRIGTGSRARIYLARGASNYTSTAVLGSKHEVGPSMRAGTGREGQAAWHERLVCPFMAASILTEPAGRGQRARGTQQAVHSSFQSRYPLVALT